MQNTKAKSSTSIGTGTKEGEDKKALMVIDNKKVVPKINTWNTCEAFINRPKTHVMSRRGKKERWYDMRPRLVFRRYSAQPSSARLERTNKQRIDRKRMSVGNHVFFKEKRIALDTLISGSPRWVQFAHNKLQSNKCKVVK
jgi:hypothetical protein